MLFAWTEPVPGGFAVNFEAAAETIASADISAATAAMNAQVEAISKRDPNQYQWTYKRYSRRPPESGETNPYHPDCY